MTASTQQTELLRAKLNLETSQMPWKELERFFAGGSVIAVSDDLDLVEVAASIANDDTANVKQWMQQNRITKVTDAQASTWLETDALLWTVVVNPWILVQRRAS